MSALFQINKGVGKPIVFRGLKGSWIALLSCGLASLVVLFAVAYIAGVPLIGCVSVVVSLATALFFFVYRLNHRYKEHGVMKAIAYRSMHKWVRFDRPLQL